MTDILDNRQALSRQEFVTTKTRLAEILGVLAEEIEEESQALIDSAEPPAFAGVIRSIADKLTDAGERWRALSKSIRDQ